MTALLHSTTIQHYHPALLYNTTIQHYYHPALPSSTNTTTQHYHCIPLLINDYQVQYDHQICFCIGWSDSTYYKNSKLVPILIDDSKQLQYSHLGYIAFNCSRNVAIPSASTLYPTFEVFTAHFDFVNLLTIYYGITKQNATLLIFCGTRSSQAQSDNK